jgi:hypothetical protein
MGRLIRIWMLEDQAVDLPPAERSMSSLPSAARPRAADRPIACAPTVLLLLAGGDLHRGTGGRIAPHARRAVRARIPRCRERNPTAVCRVTGVVDIR